ncbi:NUDIX domain-containing protein [Williamsia sp. SKLECPSW1]
MTVTEDVVRRSDGSTGIYGVVHRSPGVVVIARRFGDTESYCVVEQYRYPLAARRWEFPAGTAEVDELDTLAAAARELREETGMVATTVQVLATLDVAPGFTSQRTTIVLADDLAVGTPARDATEADLRWTWWTRDEVTDAIRSGLMVDAQSIAAWGVFLTR